MKKLSLVLILVILILTVALFASTRRQATVKNWNGVQKNGEVIADKFVESAPFVWNGELKYIVFQRDEENKKYDIAVYDFKTRKKISTFGEGLGLGSVLVRDNRLYIFATRNWGGQSTENKKSEVVMFSSSDLQNFTDPVIIYTAADRQSLFNSSVTYNPDQKKFVMALETDEPGFVAFSIRFLASNDLNTWNLEPVQAFGRYTYAACPTIRYIDGNYYLWYLKEVQFDPNQPKKTSYVEQLSKSRDLGIWQTSPQYVLTPDRADEGVDNSDIDFIEFENKVYILYDVGDQVSWSKIKYATYNGSLETWVKQFYFVDDNPK